MTDVIERTFSIYNHPIREPDADYAAFTFYDQQARREVGEFVAGLPVGSPEERAWMAGTLLCREPEVASDFELMSEKDPLY